jgi:hypothetical protein
MYPPAAAAFFNGNNCLDVGITFPIVNRLTQPCSALSAASEFGKELT